MSETVVVTGQYIVNAVEKMACKLGSPVDVRRLVLFRMLLESYPDVDYTELVGVIVLAYGMFDKMKLLKPMTPDDAKVASKLYYEAGFELVRASRKKAAEMN